MTTFGTFDIDSVPAPSDFELDKAVVVVKALNFNEFCTHACIGYDREAFIDWVWKNVGNYKPRRLYREVDWWDLWHKFCAWQDARDLVDTQADALGTLF